MKKFVIYPYRETDFVINYTPRGFSNNRQLNNIFELLKKHLSCLVKLTPSDSCFLNVKKLEILTLTIVFKNTCLKKFLLSKCQGAKCHKASTYCYNSKNLLIY